MADKGQTKEENTEQTKEQTKEQTEKPNIAAETKTNENENENEKKDIEMSNNFDNANVKTKLAIYEKRIKEFEGNIGTEMPIDNNSIIIKTDILKPQQVCDHMQQCYPLVHGSVLSLAYHFLLIKRTYGSKVEKKLYKNMRMVEFLDRLATKRAVVFFQSYDSFLLRSGYNSAGHWEKCGSDDEAEVELEHYLSYDELIISAMCGISSPTHFINNGSRRNCGKFKENDGYPIEGIYIGLVGARFERQYLMEYSLMQITETQNIEKNGYGKYERDETEEYSLHTESRDTIFLENCKKSQKAFKDPCEKKMIFNALESFYDIHHFPTFTQVSKNKPYEKEDSRYYEKPYGLSLKNPFLDLEVFKRRIRCSLEVFLFDADRRAKQRKATMKLNKNDKKLCGAYCHVVGLGTGVWAFRKREQDRIIAREIKNIVERSKLANIDYIYFAWMDEECLRTSDTKSKAEYFFDEKKHKGANGVHQPSIDQHELFVTDRSGHDITVGEGKANPADILEAPYDNCLRVAMYAWDSNAFPGNEYYHGMLAASGDPAAAACSTISYTQNSEINREYINGKNTGLYFFDEETGEYEFKKFQEIETEFDNDPTKWLNRSLLSIPYKRLKFNKNNNSNNKNKENDDQKSSL